MQVGWLRPSAGSAVRAAALLIIAGAGLPAPAAAGGQIEITGTVNNRPRCGAERPELCSDPRVRRRYENERKQTQVYRSQVQTWVAADRAEETRKAEAAAVAAAAERARVADEGRRFLAAQTIIDAKNAQARARAGNCAAPVAGAPFGGDVNCW